LWLNPLLDVRALITHMEYTIFKIRNQYAFPSR
jgi:hypothetical protein